MCLSGAAANAAPALNRQHRAFFRSLTLWGSYRAGMWAAVGVATAVRGLFLDSKRGSDRHLSRAWAPPAASSLPST